MAQVVRIAPLGTGVILPAIVIGFEEQGYSDVDSIIQELAERPPWLITLDQQAGGYAMRYPSVLGCLLRFSDNAEFARGELQSLFRAFDAMAQDPKPGVLKRHFPLIADLVGTWGSDYKPEELRRLHYFLGAYFSLPEFQSGLEAFVRCSDAEPLAWFEGWRILEAFPNSTMPTDRDSRRPIDIDDGNINWLTLNSDTRFCKDQLDQLRVFGGKLGQNEPRVFLLWENSD